MSTGTIGIKSSFVLKIIFGFLNEFKKLNIIKYNKKLQKRLNVNKNDYSTIITIKLFENRKNEFCFEFFDKSDFCDEEIYLYNKNNDKEVKNRSIKPNNNIKYIEIIFRRRHNSLAKLFSGYKYIRSVDIKNSVGNLNSMFSYCKSLEEVNFINFNFEKVYDMTYLFSCCGSLKKVSFNKDCGKNVNIKTSLVINSDVKFRVNKFELSYINADYMFDECTQLNEVWLDNTYDTYNNISMNYMFNEYTSLKKVILENFNVFAIGMFCMFKNCSSLKELN